MAQSRDTYGGWKYASASVPGSQRDVQEPHWPGDTHSVSHQCRAAASVRGSQSWGASRMCLVAPDATRRKSHIDQVRQTAYRFSEVTSLRAPTSRLLRRLRSPRDAGAPRPGNASTCWDTASEICPDHPPAKSVNHALSAPSPGMHHQACLHQAFGSMVACPPH